MSAKKISNTENEMLLILLLLSYVMSVLHTSCLQIVCFDEITSLYQKHYEELVHISVKKFDHYILPHLEFGFEYISINRNIQKLR